MFFRNLAHLLYGIPRPTNIDLDFIVEELVVDMAAPQGWQISKNKFGNPRFKKGLMQVDLILISKIHSFSVRSLSPTIENYLEQAPLTIQSIAYDLGERFLIGEIGWQVWLKMPLV